MEMNTIVSEVGTLVDIRDVSVNKELSRDERIAEFVQQIKNKRNHGMPHAKGGYLIPQAWRSLVENLWPP